MKILGIGTRVKHEDFGQGVVIQVHPHHYLVAFYNQGREKIDLDYNFEIIEYVEPEDDLVSMWEVE
ncbi:hypothetical protein [Jiulongibacter sp. NS-SX5]|uniref:hypothetical protein n=1 Tax=Jiulongibacter sp. NS-SX5 TaxID=3463854 RepID=UPI00405962AD